MNAARSVLNGGNHHRGKRRIQCHGLQPSIALWRVLCFSCGLWPVPIRFVLFNEIPIYFIYEKNRSPDIDLLRNLGQTTCASAYLAKGGCESPPGNFSFFTKDPKLCFDRNTPNPYQTILSRHCFFFFVTPT